MQCPLQCGRDPNTNLLRPSSTYTIPANSRCQYRVFVSRSFDKYGLPFTLPIDPSYDGGLSFYVRTSASGQFPSNLLNAMMSEYSARFLPITNGSYVMIINKSGRDITFRT